MYGIEVWGSALQKKHLERINDKFFKRVYRYGYILKEYKMSAADWNERQNFIQ